MSTRLMVQIDDNISEFPENFKDKSWIVILDGVNVLDVGKAEDGTAIVTSAKSVQFRPEAEVSITSPDAMPPNIWDDLITARVSSLIAAVVGKVREEHDVQKLRAKVSNVIRDTVGNFSHPPPILVLDEIITWDANKPSPILTEWFAPIAEHQLKLKLTSILGDESN